MQDIATPMMAIFWWMVNSRWGQGVPRNLSWKPLQSTVYTFHRYSNDGKLLMDGKQSLRPTGVPINLSWKPLHLPCDVPLPRKVTQLSSWCCRFQRQTIYNFLSAVHLKQASTEGKINSYRRGVQPPKREKRSLDKDASLKHIVSTYHTYENNVAA